jgi:hypothetical protein
MRKAIIITLFCIISGSVSFLIYRIIQNVSQKNVVEKAIASLPNFIFSTLNNNTDFTKADVKDLNGTIILNYFDPTCEHCQLMAEQYLEHRSELNNITILMVTKADSLETMRFYHKYHIDSLDNITVLLDKRGMFEKFFGSTVVPSFYIYKSQKIIEKISGVTRIENLIQY